MRRSGALSLTFILFAPTVWPRQDPAGCGTHQESSREAIFLHRQSMRARARTRAAEASASSNRDIGNIAIIDDSDGTVARQNAFNLDRNTLRFTPSKAGAAAYQYTVVPGAYDEAAATTGIGLAGLDDDDARVVPLPFAFPFFGASYRDLYVNSDGNLTFGQSDTVSSDRSLGRMTAGAPRISPLFADLDPSRASAAVRILAEPGRFVVSWVSVPEYQASGIGFRQTFQAALYPDGRIEFSYAGANSTGAVVGIAPGNLQGSTSLVSFRSDPSGEYSGAVAERFGDSLSIDMVSVAQKFYQTHDDAYDYLVVYNNLDIPAGPTAVAYENTVRNQRTGYGDTTDFDVGRDYGSPSRLQSVLNLGPLSQYPRDPNVVVPARRAAGDTPLTIIGHEAGHLFLAFASIRDPNDPKARPMLGAQLAHWSFLFNSEASLLEGERIEDNGVNQDGTHNFVTAGTVEGYAPLDQYLMGFRGPAEVPPTFLVTNAPSFLVNLHPARGVTIVGNRVDIGVNDVIQGEGPRIPDHTVAQRRFRFGFILIVARGTDPSADDLTRLETYRAQFEPFYAKAASDRASADATLRRSLKLSLYPAAGVVENGSATASLTIATALSSPLTIDLQAPNGSARPPAAVTIPAGARSATFTLAGVKAGVEELTAVPRDNAFETAFARIQVAGASLLRLEAVAGDHQISTSGAPLEDPVVVRLTDANRLPYPGAKLTATPSAGGSVSATALLTDDAGQAALRWTPGPAAANQLRLTVDGLTAVNLTINAGPAVPVAAAVANAASYAPGLAPGALAIVRGVNLAGGAEQEASLPWPSTMGGVSVTLNGRALPLLYVSDKQINFYVPPDVPSGPATLAIGAAQVKVTVSSLLPGIFFDAASGLGAIRVAGTADTTDTHPVKPGDYIEIYSTGLGPVRSLPTPAVFIAGLPATVVYSGETATPGLYQVNAQIPRGVPSGRQPLVMRVDTASSNEVRIGIQ